MIQIPQEFLDTLGDKAWRMSRLYDITDINGTKMVFQRNEAQKDFNQKKARRNIILKSRRLGFTTDEAIDSLDDTLWIPNFHALMLSYDVATQNEIFDKKIDFAWKNFLRFMTEECKIPSFWTLDLDRNSQLKFGFGDGSESSIQVRAKGRSGTFNRLHVSEFGKMAKEDPVNAKEIVSGTIGAVPLNGRVDIESTAEGDFGLFHDMFVEAWERGEPTAPVEFKAHFYNWQWDHAEIRKIFAVDPNLPQEFRKYQAEHNERAKTDRRLKPISDIELTYYYYRWISVGRDWDLLHQEYPTTPEEAFISSGARLFDTLKLEKMPTEMGTRVGDWIYYEDFKPGHRYGLGADPAEGVGRNNSTVAIIDFDHSFDVAMVGTGGSVAITRPKLVAEYASNKIDPAMFAYEIKSGGERYGHCIAAVERNSSGLATVSKLSEIYHNVFAEVTMGKTENETTQKLGWRTGPDTKPKMLYDANAAINNDTLLVTSAPTKRELRSYDKEDLGQVKFDEDANHHWDRVIALCIAYQMLQHAIPSAKPGVPVISTDGFDDPMDKYDAIG